MLSPAVNTCSCFPGDRHTCSFSRECFHVPKPELQACHLLIRAPGRDRSAATGSPGQAGSGMACCPAQRMRPLCPLPCWAHPVLERRGFTPLAAFLPPRALSGRRGLRSCVLGGTRLAPCVSRPRLRRARGEAGLLPHGGAGGCGRAGCRKHRPVSCRVPTWQGPRTLWPTFAGLLTRGMLAGDTVRVVGSLPRHPGDGRGAGPHLDCLVGPHTGPPTSSVGSSLGSSPSSWRRCRTLRCSRL